MAEKPWIQIRSADGYRLGWVSNEAAPTNQRNGQLGEHLDTGARFIYYHGGWHLQSGNVLLPYFSNAATSTLTPIKGTSALVYVIEVSNPNVVDAFLQLFDLALDAITVGTTAPTYSFLIPAGAGASNRGAFDRIMTVPLKFYRALNYAVTTTPTGNTAPTSTLTLNVGYV